jgi:hypothetical protein
MVDGFIFIYESRRMKSVEIVLRKEGERGRKMEAVNIKYIVNITMYPTVQLLYANKT